MSSRALAWGTGGTDVRYEGQALAHCQYARKLLIYKLSTMPSSVAGRSIDIIPIDGTSIFAAECNGGTTDSRTLE